jgi:hypothetical protein
VKPSNRKTGPMREMITTMRMWVITKASRHNVVLSWTKTIWAMVRSMTEMRQSTRERARRKIRELITIWASGIVKAFLLNSLVTKAKLIQVTSTDTKHAHKCFLSWLGDFFLHISLGFEWWLWIGWVVGFGWFEWFLFFVVVGARNKLRSTPLTLVLTSLNTKSQFVCGFCGTLLNSTQIVLNHFLAQGSFLKMCSQIGNLLLKLGVHFDSMKSLPLREPHTTHREVKTV